MVKTLVIHPEDVTTDCLSVIYEGRKDWTIVRDPSTSIEEIRRLIQKHDRVVMLGHGTPYGLLAASGGWRFGRYIVDLSHRKLLSQKETYSIWCNSDEYFRRGSQKGFHTGMIISEVGEEVAILGRAVLNEEEMAKNMELFCGTCAKYFDLPPEEAREKILEEYVGEDKVTQFNRKRIIVL